MNTLAKGSSNELIYAIDFGTTNTLCAAASPHGLHEPVPLDPTAKDPSVMRTLLYFPTMHRCYYGVEAIRQFVDNTGTGRLIRSIKKQLPSRSFIGTWIDDRPINLEDMIGYFLKEVRERADREFGVSVDKAVIGRPARFSLEDADDRFAQFRLEEAAKRAGFKHVEFCPEPLAAAFEFRARLTEPQIVLVADFGGGTSDFTVIKMSREPFHDRDVLSMGGVAVAGDALEGALMRTKISPHFGADVSYRVPFGTNVLRMPGHLIDKICSPADITVLTQRDTLEFLRRVEQWALNPVDREKMDRFFCLIEEQLGFEVFEKIEAVKCALSDSDVADFHYEHPRIHVTEPIRRQEFETAIAERLEKITRTLDETVKKAGIQHSDIDVVCCTGGTAKVPAIQEALVRRYGQAKIRQHNFFHSVVRGLSERAQTLFK